MKKLLVLYSKDDFHKEVPFEKKSSQLNNESFYTHARSKDVEVVRSSLENFDFQQNCFTKYWTFADRAWTKIEEDYQPDTILDKAWENFGDNNDFQIFPKLCQLATRFNYFNTPYFNLLFRNKFYQYTMLQDHMPQTFFIKGVAEIEQKLQLIMSEEVVIKPLYGSSGVGIYIGPKDFAQIQEFYTDALHSSFIIQEFIPIQQANGSITDYRLIFVQGHGLVHTLSRISEKGSKFTNVHMGATKQDLEPKDIHPGIHAMSTEISKKIDAWQQVIYSLDFIIGENGKIYILEMNTIPSFGYIESNEASFTRYYNAMLSYV